MGVIQADARRNGFTKRPLWPMIVFRSPKGWTGPKEVDGQKTEGHWRSHQVPMADMAKPAHVQVLETWMKSYKPEELFDKTGRLIPELAKLPPKGEKRMSANPHTNGGQLLKDLKMPDFRDYAVNVSSPGANDAESTRVMGKFLRDVMKANMDSQELPPRQPGRVQLQPLAGRPRSHEPRLGGPDLALRRPPQSRRPRDGDAQRAPVPGLAGGLFANWPAWVFQLL
jgi:hypothetical protein